MIRVLAACAILLSSVHPTDREAEFFVAGAFALPEFKDQPITRAYNISWGSTRGEAEALAKRVCELGRDKAGAPGPCRTAGSVADGCFAMASGRSARSQGYRIVSATSTAAALEFCRKDGYECLESEVAASCVRR